MIGLLEMTEKVAQW